MLRIVIEQDESGGITSQIQGAFPQAQSTNEPQHKQGMDGGKAPSMYTRRLSKMTAAGVSSLSVPPHGFPVSSNAGAAPRVLQSTRHVTSAEMAKMHKPKNGSSAHVMKE